MTSRQTIAATQRNSNHVYRIGVSSETHAIMVKIDWTDAPVVRIQAREAFKLACQLVSVVRDQYTPLRDYSTKNGMQIAAGKVLHFVKSSRGDGWYYIVQVINQQTQCSCPAHHYNMSCKHLDSFQEFIDARVKREFIEAGENAQIERVEVERGGFVYIMERIVSSSYVGKFHYTWLENKINGYPLIHAA